MITLSYPGHFNKSQPGKSSNGDPPFILRQNWFIALVYLLLIIIAELITNFINAGGGIILFFFILMGLILHFTVSRDTAVRRLLLVLCLVPLTRLIGVSISTDEQHQIYSFPVVYGLIMIAAFIIIRYLSIRPSEIALVIDRRQIRSQLLIGSAGVAFSLVEYFILKPHPFISELNPISIILPALILLIFVGFTEELIFRGLLQTVSIGLLGIRTGIIYTSVLFAILHVGYVQGLCHLTVLDVPAVFVIALFFSWIVRRTGSLLGVTLSHGLTNIGLFLVLPFLFN